MSLAQMEILTILAGAVVLFLWGRWRHDMVAIGALLVCVLLGLVPGTDAFAGFGHPAVITVACVLMLSHGLERSGAVDALSRAVLPSSAGPTLTIAALTVLGAALSAFMNNVGALALLMPVAIQAAAKQGLPPGMVLMPLSFGSILGGMTTLIGTPPNMIVAAFRADNGAKSFAMFDFTPVGLAVAGIGILFLTLLGRHLVPAREQADTARFETGAYLTEVRVTDDSKAVDRTLREVEEILEDADAQIIGMVRGEVRLTAPNTSRKLRPGDILVIEAEPESLGDALSSLGLKLEEDVRPESDDEEREEEASDSEAEAGDEENKDDKDDDEDEDEDEEDSDKAASEEIELLELAVLPDSRAIRRSATDLRLRTRYGLNLLAISRQGRRSIKRLRSTQIKAGDVLLMHGTPEALAAFAIEYGCAPLAERAIRLPDKRRAAAGTIVMGGAIAVAAFGLLPAASAFAAGVLLFMALRLVPIRTVYEAVDWPVIVLLAALIPVAGAMASTGAADLIARLLLDSVAQGHAVVALAVILVVTMTLSDFMNNAATAAMMCPIAISAAAHLGVNADAYLMAVAVGASCAFLTPIGHQNNTLILGPGGFRFGDYWKLGLPMEVLVVAVGVPALLFFWPL